MRRFGLISLVLALLVASGARAEEKADTEPPATGRTLKILPATDTSGFNIAGPLQAALTSLYTELEWFNVSGSAYALPGFTEAEVAKAHEALGADVLSFVYLEKDRIAVFLFDSAHRGAFIVDSQSLVLPAGTSMSSAWIEDRLRLAHKHVALAYRRGQFQALPGSSVDNEKLATEENEDAHARAEEAHKFFRELAASQERPYYVGGGVGLTRTAVDTGSSGIVTFGGFAGTTFNEKIRIEGGFDVFDQLGLHLGGTYKVPLNQKYVTLWVGLGFERILGAVAANNPTVALPKGSMLFGPQLDFHIPLLGVEIRGDLRYFFGGGTLLVATYGFSWYL